MDGRFVRLVVIITEFFTRLKFVRKNDDGEDDDDGRSIERSLSLSLSLSPSRSLRTK